MRKPIVGLLCLIVAGPLTSQASPLPEPREEVLALVDGLLIDGLGADPVPRAVVIIRGKEILAAGSAQDTRIPADATVLDLQGSSILPGFINAHVHQAYDGVRLRAWAQAGVTTVRDLGTRGLPAPTRSYEARNRLLRDNMNARLVAAGPILTTRGGYGNLGVDSPADARRKVTELISAGADLIKTAIEDDLQRRTWPMLSSEELGAIVRTAHAKGKWVSAHISRAAHLEMAIEAGVDDVAHMIVDSVPDELISRMVEKGIYWVPTLELWKGVSEMHSLGWDTTAVENLRRFVRAGGKVALGTDYDGYVFEFELGMPMKELRWMQASGMSPLQVIVAGTRHAAHVSGLEDKLGTIEAGKLADILVVKGNPLQDLGFLAEAQIVIHNGVVIRGNH